MSARVLVAAAAARTPKRPYGSNVGGGSFVVLGKQYEEACQAVLRSIGIDTRLVGGRMDGGVDLAGYWHLDSHAPAAAIPLIAQCKRLGRACPPSFVRELEGSVSKAAEGTVALLISCSPATKATIEALAESPAPLLFLHFDEALLRSAFANPALQRRLPRLIVGSKHVAGHVQPAFYCAE